MPLVFQYGSNTNAERLNGPTRLNGGAQDLGRAETTRKYCIAFDVWSQTNGCAASNLVAKRGTTGHAWGVLFDVSLAGLAHLREIEGKLYEEKAIRVVNQAGEKREARTFLVKRKEHRRGLWTSFDYVRHIVTGLRAHDVPEEYVQHVIDIALETNESATAKAAAAEQNRRIRDLRTPLKKYLSPSSPSSPPSLPSRALRGKQKPTARGPISLSEKD